MCKNEENDVGCRRCKARLRLDQQGKVFDMD